MGTRFFVVLLVACGGGGSGTKPDAPRPLDSQDIDAPPNATCTFTEAANGTNNTSMTAEPTGITFSSARQTICGMVNGGNFDAGMQRVDVDTYKISTATQVDVLVHVTGATGLARVQLQVGTTAGQQRNQSVYEGDHATVPVRLPAGDHVIAVTAGNPTDVPAPVPYTIAIVGDAPATRCAKVTAGPNFTEGADGPLNDGNDVYSYDDGANPKTRLTTSPTDVAEGSNLTIAAGTQYRITGSSAAVDPGDDYEDRDTFAFATGAATNQLSVRLNWASTTADFDFRIFPTPSLLTVTDGFSTSSVEDEFQTFAVKPNTTYHLWVGAYDGTSGQPAVYDATICGETFTP